MPQQSGIQDEDSDDEEQNDKFENRYLDSTGIDTKKPKINKDKNRFLKFLLTDGTKTIIGLEQDKLIGIGAETLPGTKFLVNDDIEVRRGLYLLHNENIKLIYSQQSVMQIKGIQSFSDAYALILNPRKLEAKGMIKVQDVTQENTEVLVQIEESTDAKFGDDPGTETLIQGLESDESVDEDS